MESFFDYNLPAHLIAQHPTERRDQSRLLVVNRATGSLSHHTFAELAELLAAGDLVVLNDTRVVPARLLGRRARTGGKWEGLFLRALLDGTWEMLAQTGGRPAPGEIIDIDPGPLRLRLVDRTASGQWRVRPEPGGSPVELLERHGHVPLPPYIRKGADVVQDRERYQTVYARQAGAVAAPTAGLHFTLDSFARLERRGIGRAFVTLHVGFGTFQPILVNDYTKHVMHQEWAELPAATVEAIQSCKGHGGRVVAVGTTCVRLLETAAALGPLQAWSGQTDLFIYPPYRFRVVDALLTNFHLPRSTLLLLLGAFAGVDLLHQAYTTAIAEGYRFYSYGDAMLVL